MNIETLKLKVENAKLKVLKCKGTIERHEKQLAKKIQANSEPYEIKWKQNDIAGANKKLEKAEQILNDWQKKLDLELEKERFLEGNAPKVIKDFLEEWKSNALKWHLKRYEDYQTFKLDLRKEEKDARIECIKITPEYEKYLNKLDNSSVSNIDLLNVLPRKPMSEYLKAKELDWRSIEKRKSNFAGSNVLRMDGIANENDRLHWITNLLENEKKNKMLDLINRINKEVGEITDASELEVTVKGNLDGVIHGVKGSVEVSTIGAGGFNIQCFHYRTLVKKLK